MKETRREYLKRIHFVLDFIEKHLDEALSLNTVAQLANYSAYHFHRVFLTVVNESLNAYINRKRIERIASILIVTPNVSLKELAFQYGFNSESSFSRAFKKYYGVSPTAFKTEGKKILSKIGIAPFSSEPYIYSITHSKQWITMNAQIMIKELPALQLASIAQIGEFDKAGTMFQKLMEWGHQKKVLDLSNFKAITVYHDNPNVTKASQIRFSAGITLNQPISADGAIRPLTLRGGIYVVGHFEIKAEEISKAWKNMCVWVLEEGYEFRDGDYFEIYHNDPKTHPEQKNILEICIPLVPTDHLKLKSSSAVNFSKKGENNSECEQSMTYHQLIGYMQELRLFFKKEYESLFIFGNIYKGSPIYSYFSLTTEELKKQKLKFVIILNHQTLSFSICLSGQNKKIRKKYWELFHASDWDRYHLAEGIEESLSILDHTIAEKPNFGATKELTEQIDKEAMQFIKALTAILEN